MSIRSSKFRKLVLNLGLISVAGILSACNVESATNKTPQPVEGNATSTVNLRVIETTDIHSYLTAYDYYKDKVVDNFGLTRAASLVKQARSEVKNSVLVDNGDLIQGSLIGQYAVDEGLKNQIHPWLLSPLCNPSSKKGNQTRNWVDDPTFFEGLYTW